MKFVMTFVWAFILGQVLCYVISSMTSTAFNVGTASIFGVIIFILVSLIGSVSITPPPATDER
ncbi:hypothetical protein ACA30_05260 [Virgibacillus soli]|uniref:DUF2929 domain-containing protein n=2 Tax=Lederbergia galactosidilytica TaxID=217031 RepID=A0A177ZIF0_9BACI|nr:hypothetical protein ACA30_05260 [Virgibacillus soli]MBP1915681.1 hypothetical protein [Lederbergia galactosidilytica]OAK67737.1 hypothetical protein ABB05_18730 [Lederbergia galactosidilytica]